KYEEERKRRKRKALTRWLALASLIHHKFGGRHFLLISIMALYAVLGGVVFQYVEAANEKQVVNNTIKNMNVVIDEFVALINNYESTDWNRTSRVDALYQESKRFYKKMLMTEGRYTGSAWHKSEDLEQNIQWTFLPAMFYAFTLFSTIGYGTIACHTWLGRYASIVYSCIGIPLMLLTIGDLGEVIQRRLCRLLTRLNLQWSCWRRRSFFDEVEKAFNGQESEGKSEEEEDALSLPLWITGIILLTYLCIVSLVIYIVDRMGPQETDFTLAASFYFVFISISTTGFGDVMPNTAQFHPLTLLAFLIGLVIISIMNTSMYSHLYNFFYTRSMRMEKALEEIHERPYEPPGHRTFKKLYPAFTLLSLSFPSSAHSIIDHPVMPEIPVADPLLKRKHGLGLLQPLAPQERSHSTNYTTITDVTSSRISRAMSVESGQRSPGLFCAPVSLASYKHHGSRVGSATLGTLGGIDIAAANRRREMARMRKETARSNDRPFFE
ncbi:hypothetical protein PMAYCL1PPCAC_03458, partial [Pristionchus mayeri]